VKRQSMVGRRRLAGAVGVVSAVLLGSCASNPATTATTTTQPVTPTRPPGATLPSMPLAGATGAGDQLVVSTGGAGSRKLPPVTIEGATLFVEVACQGGGSLLVDIGGRRFRPAGPCRGVGGDSTTTIAAVRGRQVSLSVTAPPGTRWELYMTESPS
jgi:hypothetical protein